MTITERQIYHDGITFTQSSLALCGLQINDAGYYTCTASNIVSSVNETTYLEVIENTGED